VRFAKGTRAADILVKVTPSVRRQRLEGIGGALTEASASVLAQLAKPRREAILDQCFGPNGARFSMARTHIGACDFSVEGKYSYDDVPGDVALQHFSLAPDRRGFKGARNPGYALLPLLKDALLRRPDLKIVASPWTAPAWMKDNRAWYAEGRGGTLLPEHFDTFARYVARYLQACRAEGVRVWGITPVNEPLGNGGQWESMEFTPEGLRDFVRDHLGPTLHRLGLADVKLIGFDHNRDANAIRFTECLLGDPMAARYVWGTGLHWYSATGSANTKILDHLRQRFPDKALLHTEGCIDGIGTEDSSPKGAFLGWKNDAWWWQEGATDWGYYWASPEQKPSHPRYVPVHRYARDLVDGLNHGFVGWIDWNLVLDKRGGPNHVNNFCAAPIMVDTDTEEAYVTPLFLVMAHFSRYLQPGDQVVQVEVTAAGSGTEDVRATAALSQNGRYLTLIVFNQSHKALTYAIQVGGAMATVRMPANSLQTLRINQRRSLTGLR
jgi:glucosylceramidase